MRSNGGDTASHKTGRLVRISLAASLIVTAFMAALGPLPVQAAGPAVTLAAGSLTAAKGETVTVAVQTTEAAGLYGYSFTVAYDKEMLQLVPAADGAPATEVGAVLGANAFRVMNEETLPGRIEVAATRSGSGSAQAVQGKLASLTFKGLAEGTAKVKLEEVLLADSQAKPIPDTTGSGTELSIAITATSSQPTPSVTPSATPSPTPSPSTGNPPGGGGTPGGGSVPGGGGVPGDGGIPGGGGTPGSALPVVDLGPAVQSKPTTDSATGRTTVTVTLDTGKAMNLLQGNDTPAPRILRVTAKEAADTIQLELSGTLAQQAAGTGAQLELATAGGMRYQIPTSAIDLSALTAALAQQLGTTPQPEQLVVRLVIEPSAGLAEAAGQEAELLGFTPASRLLDFRVEVEAGGQVAAIRTYGRSFAERELPLDRPVDPEHATGVYFDGTTYHHVPTYFTTNQDGSQTATLRRNGDSAYTVVERARTFGDIQKHWAQADIEAMASKLIVTGQQEDRFHPQGEVTRAEFAAMLVRALGYEGQPLPAGTPAYTDVAPSSWYHDAVRLAAYYGLVEGYPGNRFEPGAPITRQELAVMLGRAMELTGKTLTLQPTEVEQTISRIGDRADIGSWAKTAVAGAWSKGLVTGYDDGTFHPTARASRAEAAVMIRRLLTQAGWMNAIEAP